ncbi:hypothetical protein PhCBS80983_g03845 [Powellomyces hirtus]|uniref:CBS domain-containing protein n=1 Tax=Powellomyces hirtus TaxID=109895 RepID=A0A507E0R9_9FUNG|nr:hypothetical protein PhCBS80983_g03845 [Powellomyces hirtus]
MGQEHSTFFSEQARCELLASPVGDVLLLNRPLVTVGPQDSLVDVLRMLRLNNISCMPITGGQRENAEARLIDVVDIVTFITNSYAQLGVSSFNENIKSIMKVACDQLAGGRLEYERGNPQKNKDESSQDIETDFSTKNPTHCVSCTTPVASAIHKMTELKIARLALLDSGDKISHLITQSNVIEFVLLNLDALHPEPDSTLRELRLPPTSPVVACYDSSLTMQVLQDMRNKKVTAVPVLNDQGVMTGVMTVRHLKNLVPETIPNLFLPVSKFLSAIGATYVTGSQDMTLRNLLRVMVVNTYHHLFFLDEAGRVEGVVTLSDLIRWCV